MSQDRETNVALLIDFDNVALGARDAGQRFDIKLLIGRILEKGKVLVKKAYADWHYYKEHMSALHESAVELIEIPMPRISGKNSADIKLVVDAMELCYANSHIDTFVIVSGDSDFSPLVSKLRENNKWVIGVGVKNSSSKLLIGNCDEFMFYDDIFRQQARHSGRRVKNVPEEKRELFDFLVSTTQSLLQESKGVLYSSLIKDTMTRKRPDFNERAHGYSNFGDLLEDARNMGLLIVERDAHAGGTWVVQGLAKSGSEPAPNGDSGTSSGGSRSSRRRRRSSRGRGSREAAAAGEAPAAEETSPQAEAAEPAAQEEPKPADRKEEAQPAAASGGKPESPQEPTKKTTRKKAAKKAPARRKTTKKAPAGDTSPKKTSTKKTAAKKTTSTKKKVTKKTPSKKTSTKKTSTKKAATKKTSTGKAAARKTGARKKATSSD